MDTKSPRIFKDVDVAPAATPGYYTFTATISVLDRGGVTASDVSIEWANGLTYNDYKVETVVSTETNKGCGTESYTATRTVVITVSATAGAVNTGDPIATITVVATDVKGNTKDSDIPVNAPQQ